MRLAHRIVVVSVVVLAFCVGAAAQTTATYHLHAEASAITSGDLQLKTAGPDVSSSSLLSPDLMTYSGNNCAPIAILETQSGVPGRFGTIAAGQVVTFTVWMRVTSPSGTIYPCLELDYGTGAWIVNGTTPLTTTLTKYIINATLASNATIASTDRAVLKVSAKIQNVPGLSSQAELGIEGVLNGNFDSTVLIPLPPPPLSVSLALTNGPSFAAPANIGLLATASAPGGTIANVTFYNGTTMIGPPVTTSPYSFTWIGIGAGTYSLTARVIDTLGNEASSTPPLVVTVTGTGTLTGSHGFSVPLVEDLTADGASFWAHWGYGGPSGFDTKKCYAQQISNVTKIGTAAIQGCNYNSGFTWTDGTPTLSLPAPTPNTFTGISISGVNNGLQITVAADTTLKTLTVLVGVASATATIQASLSDGQAPVYVDPTFNSPTSPVYLPYVFTFKAGSIGQTLTVSITEKVENVPGNGAVILGGAFLTGENLPVTIPVISSTSAALALAGMSVTITGSGFGPMQASSTLSLNGLLITPTSWSASTIVFTVPAGATSGNLVVTTLCGNNAGFPLAVVNSGGISGLITNSGNSKPIAGALVQALQSGVTIDSAMCDSLGNYAITNLPVGTYDVVASASGFTPATSAGRVVTIGAVTTTNLTMALGQPGTIAGRVTIADGITGIAGATLAVSRGILIMGSALSDSTGAYSVTGLAPDTYSIRVLAVGYSGADKSGVTVFPALSTTVNFSLLPASIFYTYDDVGRLISVVDSSTDTAIYSYDSVGNLLSIGRHPSSAVSIIGFQPASGPAGTLVTINGTGFSAIPGQNSVTFHGVAATVSASTPVQLVATVPSGATTGTVAVTSPSGSATSASPFSVQALGAPTITSFTPTMGNPGSTFTITGTNYQTPPTADSASINSGLAPITAVTSTLLTVTVPTTSGSGHVSVSTVSGTAQSAGDFIIPPPAYDISRIDFAARVSLGGNARTSIITAQHIALAIFEGQAGKNVSVAVSGITLPTGSTVTVLSPNLASLATATLTNGAASVLGPISIGSDGTYTVVILGSAAGAATVEVDGTGLTVSLASPAAGSMAGGTPVTITGSGFVPGTGVMFGGAVATNVSITSGTTLMATTPPHPAGPVSVAVIAPDGHGGALQNGFTFVPPPSVTQVSPSSGLATGGTAVTITGANFQSGATITFGGTAATGTTFVNATTLTAATPAHIPGAVNVVVTNPDGQAATLAGGFTYNGTAPAVTSANPNNGPSTGGQSVTLTGTGFVSGAAVTFGGTAATGVNVTNTTTLTATTPAHAAGAVNVTVTNPDTQSGTKANGYTYNAGPSVTQVAPSVGPIGGGTAITITGVNFVSGATVTIGGTAATGVSVVNGTTLTATTPAHASTSANVVVTNPDGQLGTLSGGFTYALLDYPFTGSSVNTTIWTVGLVTVTPDTVVPVAETAGSLRIGNTRTGQSGNHYNGIKSVAKYDLSGAFGYVQMVQAPPSGTSVEGQLSLVYTSTNWYGIEVRGQSSVICRKTIGGTLTQLNSTPYNATNHQFLRIRHDSASGNVIFEAAPNNGGKPGAWTQLYSEALAGSVNIAQITIEVRGGTFQSEGTAGQPRFNNLRVAKP